jgi:hypothetical protein
MYVPCPQHGLLVLTSGSRLVRRSSLDRLVIRGIRSFESASSLRLLIFSYSKLTNVSNDA